MVATSFSMIKKINTDRESEINFTMLALMGLIRRCNNRLSWLGGGFNNSSFIVFDLPMKQASRYFPIHYFINSMIGFTGDLLGGITVNLKFLALSLMAVAGLIVGYQKKNRW
jgi:hypothetical protein